MSEIVTGDGAEPQDGARQESQDEVLRLSHAHAQGQRDEDVCVDDQHGL